MAYPKQYTNPGLYVDTTQIWDMAQQVQQIDVTSPEFKELLVRLYQNINKISIALNNKDSAIYSQEEFVNGQSFPALPTTPGASPQQPRQVFRKIVEFGALPNTATKSVAHGITVTSGFNFTRIYATSSDKVANSYIPIPYASPTAANNIEINVDSTNVNITTGINRAAYTDTWVILEYLKN